MYWSSLSPPWWWDMESTWEALSPGINRPYLGFPGASDGKESACNVGDQGLIPGLGRSPGEGKGYPLQHSCLENPHGQRSLAGYSPSGHKELDTD